MGNALIGAVLVALAMVAFFTAIYSRVERPDDMGNRLDAYASVQHEAGEEHGKRKRGFAGIMARLDRLLSTRSLAQRLALQLAQANIRMTVPEFLVIMGSSAVAGAALGYLVQGAAISGMAGAILGGALPWVNLERKRGKRIKAFHDQLTDVLALVVGSLRGGHAFSTALELVSHELAAPASEEFSRVLREMGFGLSQTEALNNLVKRMESDDLTLVVTAVNISHEVGGSLSTVLERIAETIRERIRLQGEIRVLTTQQRLTTYLLVALPLVLATILALINPAWMMRLIAPGWVRIIPIAAAAMEVIGFFVSRKLTQIEV